MRAFLLWLSSLIDFFLRTAWVAALLLVVLAFCFGFIGQLLSVILMAAALR